MLIHSAVITGSVQLNNTDVSSITNVAGFATTSSVDSLVVKTGSYASTSSLNELQSKTGSYATTSSVNNLQSVTGSYATTSSFGAYTSSNDTTNTTQNTRLSTIESVTGSYATTSSVNNLQSVTGSYATTGSNQFNGNQSISGSITSNGTITAQTLVVQTITSSVDFVTGSTRNGSLSSNTHQFTGSVGITGSLAINGTTAVVGTGTTNELSYWVTANSVGALSVATYPSLTELSYVKGVTSAIQTQLNAKQSTITLTTTGTSGAATFSSNTLNIPQYAAALSGTTNYVPKFTSASTLGNSNLINDASGNLGLGVTPSAWGSGYKGIEIATLADIVGAEQINTGINYYVNTSSQVIYKTNAPITIFNQYNGSFKWLYAASGTGAATLTQAMTLDAAGTLFIGKTNNTLSNTTGISLGSGGIFAHSSSGNGYIDLGATRASVAENIGGIVQFRAVYRNSDNDNTSIAFIKGMREDATNNLWRSYLSFETTNTDGYTISEKMRITAAGNVGIGITSPQRILTVYNSNSATLYQTPTSGTSATDGFYVGQTSDVSYLWNYNNFPLVFATNNTERMRITSAGNVAIGRTTAEHRLDLQGNALIRNSLQNASFFLAHEADNSSTFYQYNNGTLKNVISSNGNSYITGGNLGIGTSSPSTLLHAKTSGDGYNMLTIEATAGDAGIALKGGTGGTSVGGFTIQGQNGGSMVFVDRNSTPATRMTISSNGSIGAPTGTNIYNASDVRLKKNISTTTYGLNAISALNPVKFNWVDGFELTEDGKDLLGFVAQEVQTVIPEAVESFGGNSITIGDTVIDNPLRVNDKFIIPVLVKAIQEQQAQIEELKTLIKQQ